MKRRFRKSRTSSMGAWIAGLAMIVGAAVVTMSSLPSARRYLRVRAM